MKNATTKGEVKRGKWRSKPRTSLKIGKEDLSRLPLISLAGLISALSILERMDVGQILGGFLISFVLLFILYKDLTRYKPAYFKNYNMLLLLFLLIILTLSLGRFFHYLLYNFSKGIGFIPIESVVYGMPLAAGAMLATILFDFHTALVFSFTISILTSFWLHDASYAIYAFVGSLTGAFSVMRCNKWSVLFRGGLWVLAINIFTVMILFLFKGNLFTTNALSSIVFANFAGISIIPIVSLVLPLLQYAFNVTTDISLIELLDLNQPLMRNLIVTAPGTYHHSVIVGNLAESAAEAVGGNPLLARVSAYYHDIGKLRMPAYFIENQSGTISKHDNLTPHMSNMIIVNHVKEGVEMAKQEKLPQPIIDIVQQHHGTTLMTYFYQKAKEQGNGTPSEDEYRYPGPKPQTRVAALIMIADAVEAASRVLTDPTPARISSLVDRIINHIFIDGQLDECELTLKDIHEVKKRFTYILTGILHKRVDYPGFDFTDEGLYKESAKSYKGKSAENGKAPKEGTPSARPSQS